MGKRWGQTQRRLSKHWKRTETSGKQKNPAKTWRNRGKVDVEVREDQLFGRMQGKVEEETGYFG